jgi:multidrug efflux pump subunit AcrA (membrane-fusion protein)
MRNRGIITFVVIVLFLGGAGLLSWWLTSMKPAPEAPVANTVTRLVQTRMVSYQDLKSDIEVPGRLASGRVIDVVSEVSGEILRGDIPLKEGQNFNKGQLICTIYDKQRILDIKASKSQFMNSLANTLADIKFDYPDHYDNVFAFFEAIKMDEALPELPEISDKSLRIFLASRNILNQYYGIKSQEEMLAKHYISAPFTGSIMEVYIEAGGIANMGTRIARIIKTDVLELEVPIEVDNLQWIHRGDEVVVLDETGTHEWPGKVVRISSFVDPATQAASVFVEVNNSPTHPIYAGMYLRARFDEKTIAHAMEIPRQAVFNQNEVFMVKDSLLEKHTIDIKKVNENTVIFDGLEAGDEVVIEALVNVKEGTRVKTRQL